MAYNYMYPFQPYQFQQPIQQPLQQPIQQQPQQMQNGGFISVSTEEEALKWAVAPGNFITFKVQGKPIVIEKSMGFSQLEEPKIERYRLVKEDAPEEEPVQKEEYALKRDVDTLEAEIDGLKKDLEEIKGKGSEPLKTRNSRKKEVADE